MSGCNHDKCLRDGCSSCCYCNSELRQKTTKEFIEQVRKNAELGQIICSWDDVLRLVQTTLWQSEMLERANKGFLEGFAEWRAELKRGPELYKSFPIRGEQRSKEQKETT